jgi:hypothetical protein
MSESAKLHPPLALFAAAVCYGVVATMTASNAAEPSAPDIGQLIELGKRTQERLTREAASWTGVHETPVGHLYVKVTATPEKRRVVFIDTGVDPNTQQPSEILLAQVIMRDGFWYVLQGNQTSKYRPFEALFNLPSLNDYLARTNPQFADEESLKRARFDTLEDGAAFFRVPMSVAMRGLAEGTIEKLRSLNDAASGTGVNKEQRTRIEALEQTLDRGVRLGIDLTTGIIVRQGIHGQRRWLRSFGWEREVDENLFSVEGRSWADETAEFDLSNPGEIAMINYCPAWRPGMTSDIGLTAVLINLTTGRLRRIPYDNGCAAPGCFSADRKSVFVMGSLGEYGAVGLFELDPIQGSRRRLGDSSPAYGAIVFPKLSADGQTLAAARMTVRRRVAPNPVQIALIDVASGQARDLGEPLDLNALSWLPDSTGLIVGRWDDRATRKVTICRVDCRSGELTHLRSGESPVVLRKSKRILFQDRGDDRWMTCKLDGSNAVLVGDGLQKFGLPSASPTGEKVLMMKFGGPDGPQPHIVDPTTGKSKTIKVGKGAWTMPAWE